MLQPEQLDLLRAMVDAYRSEEPNQRQPFLLKESLMGTQLEHPRFLGKVIEIYKGNLDTLLAYGYLRRQDSVFFDLTPTGLHFHAEQQAETDEPVAQVEAQLRRYLESATFQGRYPRAYAKWVEAERRLWDAATHDDFTVVGHLCREAMQEFAVALSASLGTTVPKGEMAKTRNIVKTLIAGPARPGSSSEGELLEALWDYWCKVDAIVQRQVHGGQREGVSLSWEDARRVVFQLCNVVYELDRGLRPPAGQ